MVSFPEEYHITRGYTSLVLTIGGKRNVNVLRKHIELRATSVDII
jgi:hypothetical protein